MTATMRKTEFQQWLISVDACAAARKWAAERTAKESWAQCERADWLLWWAARAKVDRKVLVRCACRCARRALKYVPAGETRPLVAIETAEAWCEDKATIEQVRTAADDAADDARDKEMKAMCAIVREMIPFPGTPQ